MKFQFYLLFISIFFIRCDQVKNVDISNYKQFVNKSILTEDEIKIFVARLEAAENVQKVEKNFNENGVQGRFVITTADGEIVKLEEQNGYEKGNESNRFYFTKGQLIYANYSQLFKESEGKKPSISELMVTFGDGKILSAQSKSMSFDQPNQIADMGTMPYKSVSLNYSVELKKIADKLEKSKKL